MDLKRHIWQDLIVWVWRVDPSARRAALMMRGRARTAEVKDTKHMSMTLCNLQIRDQTNVL